MKIPAQSGAAAAAFQLVDQLQRNLVRTLEAASARLGEADRFEPADWGRDDGRHGGGIRYVALESATFDRASINVSQVHYDDLPDKRLSSATALSTIIHPAHPRAPSMHMHISWTEMRDGAGYWRIMADLNPAIEDPAATARFEAALVEATGELYAAAKAQGDRYFFIPALGRHRGVIHLYCEAYATADADADSQLASRVGRAVIKTYAQILEGAIVAHPTVSDEERAAQLAYHSLYLFQVLTLDRGTTSGLLVHDQNDVGILGSLPSRVDTQLLRGWRAALPQPQDKLLDQIVAVLEGGGAPGVAVVTDEAKAALAQAIRGHYRAHPEALALQARGDVVPPTVANHR